jgi:hypothetical protein
MVAAVRRGASLRAVAHRFRVGVATVQLWVQHPRHQRLDRMDRADRPPIPRTIRRTDAALEDLVLTRRRELKDTSALGEFGAAAIRRELLQRGIPTVPSRRTISGCWRGGGRWMPASGSAAGPTTRLVSAGGGGPAGRG